MSARGRTILAALVLVTLVQHGAFLAVDRTPQHWDPSVYQAKAYELHRATVEGGLDGFVEHTVRGAGDFGPSTAVLLQPLFALVERPTADHMSLWLGGLSWIAVLASVCAMGRRLGDERTGLWAAGLTACTPGIVGLFHLTYVDVPLTACACLAMWALVASDGLRRTGPTLAFGALAGAATLVKLAAPAILWAPALAALVLALRASDDRAARRALLLRSAGAAAAAVVVAGLLWWPRRDLLLRHWFEFGWGAPAEPWSYGSPWNPLTHLAFVADIVVTRLGVVHTVALALAVPVLRRRREAIMPAAWLVGTWLVFTASEGKISRYIIPALPAVSLLVAMAVTARPAGDRTGTLLGRIRPAVLATAAAVQLAWFVCMPPQLVPWHRTPAAPALEWYADHKFNPWLVRGADPRDWHTDEAADRLVEVLPPGADVLVLANHPTVNESTLWALLHQRGRGLVPRIPRDSEDPEATAARLVDDPVVRAAVIRGEPRSPFPWGLAEMDAAERRIRASGHWRLHRHWTQPDGVSLELWLRGSTGR